MCYHALMSKGPGQIERRIGELLAATKDRALSVGDIAAHAYELPTGIVPNRKQRLSATRAAHRLLHRAAEVSNNVKSAFDQAVAETTAKLGRPPHRRSRADSFWYFIGAHYRVCLDRAFAEAMEAAPAGAAYTRALDALEREAARFDGVLLHGLKQKNPGWRTTETRDRRLWFHPADYPVRIWAVDIQREGVVWADAEITGLDNAYARIRYRGQPARLHREQLARSWTLYRNVYFTSSRSGRAAAAFEQMWHEQYWRSGAAPPPAMQMPLAQAIKLLGVPADYTRDDVIAAFRRAALRCHPDHGGTEAQFIDLVQARDRLLAALGTRAAAPKMPQFAPRGARLRYRTWRPSGWQRIGHTQRLPA
jgi:hypothetical protein